MSWAQHLRRPATVPGLLVSLAIGLAVAWAAYEQGSFGTGIWSVEALLVWWLLLLGTIIRPGSRGRLGRAAIAVAVLIVAFAGLTGLSGLWASGAESAELAFGRGLLYAGVAVLVLRCATLVDAPRIMDGLGVGIVAIELLALTTRFFPHAFSASVSETTVPDAFTRLSYPIGYWNGLAVLAGLSCPLVLRRGTGAGRRDAFALAAFPASVAVAYLASSRTGMITIAVSTALYVALSRRRAVAVAAVAVIVPSVAAAFAIGQIHAITDGPLRDAAAVSGGRWAALAVIAAGVIAVVLYQALHDLTEALRMTRRQWRALAMGATVVVIAAIVLAHPVRRWHSFTQPPPTFTSVGYTQTHFLSGNGNWRYQFWSQAVDELETRPLLGRGAGSFSAWWEQHGPGFVANPHSLYFQTLGDLGLVGFALLAGAFGIGAVAAFRRLRRLTNPLADSVAAALAAFVAYAIAAGVDWLWELPAITAPAVALLALSLAPSEPQLDVVRTRTLWPAVGALAAAAVVLFAADLKLGDWFLTASRSAASRGDLPRALDDARTAHRLQPWSASAQLQVALVQEAQGQLSDAESSVEKAIRLDSSDWRTFYIAARIQKARGAADRAEASLAAVRRLNPHAPVPQGG